MAELTTLARPYAKAAFESALSAKTLPVWSKSLVILAEVLNQEVVIAIVSSPNLTAEEKSKTIIDVCGDELNQSLQNFVAILATNDRLALLPQISALYELYKANQEKSVDVAIETAFELTKEQLTALESSLKKTLARDVEFTTSVNKDLLGGVFIRAGDTVIDASIRGRLSKLAGAMNA